MMETPHIPQKSIFARIFHSPEERRLRAGWRLLGQFLIMATLSFLFGLIILGVLGPTQISPIEWIAQVSNFFTITVGVYIARRLLDRRSFLSLGLKWNAKAVRDLLFGFLLTGFMMGLIYLVDWVLGWLRFEGYAWETGNGTGFIRGVFLMLAIFIGVGWNEELISRGYWLQNIAEGLNLFWGVILSSIFFAMAHLLNPNVSGMAILGLVLAGMFLAYGYLRTRQLWLPIGLHVGWNFFEGVVFGFQVSGLSEMPRLIFQTVNGPELITGGAFGPEAGLVMMPVLALGAIVIRWYTRGRAPAMNQGEA